MYSVCNSNELGCFKADEICLIQIDAPDDKQEELAKTAAKTHYLIYEYFWNCEACSDSGIDYREETQYFYRISPDLFVLNNTEVVGMYYKSHFFAFADDKSREFYPKKGSGSVGGWGDVTEYEYYKLMDGIPPEDSKELPSDRN